MANNRMYLKCTKCESTEEKPNCDRILIAKYYPSQNWVFFFGSKFPTTLTSNDIHNPGRMMDKMISNEKDLEDRADDFNNFFDAHRHEDAEDYNFRDGGKNFVIEFET